MPLPVSAEHLKEFEEGDTVAGYADASGVYRLRRPLGTPYLLYVSPGPFDENASAGTTYRFLLTSDDRVFPVGRSQDAAVRNADNPARTPDIRVSTLD